MSKNMKNRIICKCLAVTVILLFVGLAVQPSVAVQPEPEIIDVEPKDYLFQTIIDISNNPEVKELFEQYDNDLFNVDIERSVYRQLFLRNPRLFFYMLFTEPSISLEYLDKCYNSGLEITNILGEDKVLEIIENVEVTDAKLFDGINDIISKDEELLDRLVTIKEMNKGLNPNTSWDDYPLICLILAPLFAFLFLFAFAFLDFTILLESSQNPIILIFERIISWIFLLFWTPIAFVVMYFTLDLGCIVWY
jgi:hypothetical protein